MRSVVATLRESSRSIGAAASLASIFVAVVSIPLAIGSALELTDAQVSAWILGIYGLAGILTILLVLRYRQPLLVTGNVFILIFVSRLGTDFAWAELVGASILAGLAVLVLGLLGLTQRLARLLPPPVVFGLLAGAVLPFVVDMFTAFGNAELIVGATLLAYLYARFALEARVPAILVALVVGALAAALSGAYGPAPSQVTFPAFEVTAPTFSADAIITATPVMIALITLQANIPSLVFLRSQDYDPPERAIEAVSGLGTVAGSVLGPMGVSLSLPATALCAGPDAGPPRRRHRAAYIAGGASLAIGLLAGLAPDLQRLIPAALLDGLVGLAVLSVLGTGLQRTTEGPLVLGPLFAFAIALSELELLGLGAFFWALMLGVAVSLTVEREKWKALSAAEKPGLTEEPGATRR